MANSKELYVMMGSDSDKPRVVPGIEEFKRRHPISKVHLDIASVDNTPKKVSDSLDTYITFSGESCYLPAAGMSHGLSIEHKKRARLGDLVAAVPLTDDSSRGLTAFLSAVERPPLNPVLTVGPDNTACALEIAYNFLNRPDSTTFGVEVYFPRDAKVYCPDELSKLTSPKFWGDIAIPLKDIDIYGVGASSYQVIVTPLTPNTLDLSRRIDARLAEKKGIQIIYPAVPIHSNIQFYQELMGEMRTMQCTGATTSLWPINAAIMAAILTKNRDALSLIQTKKEEKARKLEKIERVTF